MSYSYPNEFWSYASLRFPVSSATLARTFGTHFVGAPARVACSRTLHFCRSGTINAYANPFKSKPAGSSHVCRGSGQGSTEQSLPEEDSDNGEDSTEPISDDSISPGYETREAALQADWRTFRASLVAGEQVLSDSLKPDNLDEATADSTTWTVGKNWAHPLTVPEAGCVLVASEKLDGEVYFERSVILLLRVGSNQPREGPFGIILNRPILQSINELEPTNRTLANTFGKCQLFYGGPLESDMFLLMQESRAHNNFEEVIPGIYYGCSDGLQDAADLVNDGAVLPHDFRFYVGYAGWALDQLMNEIATGLWCVAACSPDLIRTTSSDSLWQEVLLLMGGHYADLSRKSKGNGF